MATLDVAPGIATDTITQVAGGPAELLTVAAPEGEGVPVLFHLATPSLPLPFFEVPAAARSAVLPGIRPISYFRPGYRATEGRVGRSVADAAADTAAVLDRWGVERAVMFGGSGGGPHALACAALIPDRVAGVVLDGSPAPFDLLGPEALDGMADVNRVGFEMSRSRTGDLLQRMHAVFDPSVIVDDPDGIVQRARTAVMSGLPFGTSAEFFAGLLARDGRGWADDVTAISGPWGFGLADVAAPVHVFFGSRDTLTPPAHGRFLADHVPGAIAHPYEGGHGALLERMPDVISVLRDLGGDVR